MTIGEDIFTELSGDSGVTTLVGTRIYPVWINKGATYPAITYVEIAGIPQLSITGPTSLTNHTIQFDCWAKTYSQAQAVAVAVIAALNGATLFKANQNSSQDFYEPEFDVHRVSVDFSIWQ